MAAALTRLKVPLRPHMKTAKSIDVARLALAGQPGGITVSTLAEVDYFLGHGITDILYAVGITPQKLEQVCKLNAGGAQIIVITDDPTMADLIAAQPSPPRTLIEIDSGEERGGVGPESDALLELAARLGRCLSGVMTHAGHSYAGRSVQEIARVAEAERRAVTDAARRLREEGYGIEIVSAGSSPTARHAENFSGVTEMRAGVYMFGDLFQSEIETHGDDAIAVTVPDQRHWPSPWPHPGGRGGIGAVKGSQHGSRTARLWLRLGPLHRRDAQPRTFHRAKGLSGTWNYRAGPRQPGGSADWRQAADRSQPYLYDCRRA